MCLQRHKVTTQWLAELNGKLNGTDRQTSCAHSIERDLLASLQRNQDQVFFYVTDLNQDKRSRTTFRVYIAGILVSMYLTNIVHHLLSLKLLIFYVSIQIGFSDLRNPELRRNGPRFYDCNIFKKHMMRVRLGQVKKRTNKIKPNDKNKTQLC